MYPLKPDKTKLRTPHRAKQHRAAFITLEVIFSLALLGIALGLLGHLYLTHSKESFPIVELDTIQEQALNELESTIAPTPHTILSTDGKAFCEGELFTTHKAQSTFTLFVPKKCDTP